jgi:hypothetical protein
VTVAEAVAHALRPGRSSLRVQASAASRVNGSQFVAISLYGVVSQFELGAGRAHAGLRRIVARVPARRQSVGAVWLTNLTASHLPDLIDLTALGHRTGRDLKRMNDESGLRHFEGRSFRGWHHHVTLASVAHASRLLTELAADDCDADPTARPAAG